MVQEMLKHATLDIKPAVRREIFIPDRCGA
jgi:hypothetical protein